MIVLIVIFSGSIKGVGAVCYDKDRFILSKIRISRNSLVVFINLDPPLCSHRVCTSVRPGWLTSDCPSPLCSYILHAS